MDEAGTIGSQSIRFFCGPVKVWPSDLDAQRIKTCYVLLFAFFHFFQHVYCACFYCDYYRKQILDKSITQSCLSCLDEGWSFILNWSVLIHKHLFLLWVQRLTLRSCSIKKDSLKPSFNNFYKPTWGILSSVWRCSSLPTAQCISGWLPPPHTDHIHKANTVTLSDSQF